MPCSPGMRRCKPTCAHRALVAAYRDARHAAELQREAVTLGYDTETREHPPPPHHLQRLADRHGRRW